MKPVQVGIIGCGNISGIYLQAGKRFDAFEIAACADLDRARAKAAAAEHGVPKACTVKQMLADKKIGITRNSHDIFELAADEDLSAAPDTSGS